jgi:hypothetical protein
VRQARYAGQIDANFSGVVYGTHAVVWMMRKHRNGGIPHV